MSLLSRLDRLRDKDADIKKNEENGEPAEDAAPPAPLTKPAALPSSSPAGGVVARRLAPDNGDNGNNDEIPSKPSRIKVSGGAVRSPEEAAADAASGLSVPPVGAPNGELKTEENAIAVPEESVGESETHRLFDIKHTFFDHVIGSLDPRLWNNPQRTPVREALEKSVDQTARGSGITLNRSERDWLLKEFQQEVIEFGPITSLLDDPAVGKITINSADDVWIERLGQPEKTAISFRDDDHVLTLIRRIAEIVGGRIDAKVPLLDRPLPDGARVRAKVPPISPTGPTITIEKSGGNPFEALRRQHLERQRADVQPYAQLREKIQHKLVQDLDRDSLMGGDPERLRGQVEEMISVAIREERVAMSRAERAALTMDLLNEIIGLGPIEPLLNDPEIDEVMVNGPFQIYVERRGKLELSDKRFRDNEHVLQVIERIVAPLGRRIDEKSPMVDGRLRDGSRFNAIIPPLSLSGPTMTIRKFARDPFTMTDLINFGTLTREAAQFMQAAVESRFNIVVSGGTGSGKTTTLNVLSSFIPSTERIVTIEDAAELQMRQEHVIRLETRPPNIEGSGQVSIRDLVRNSLRMRPDRIVIGECRGAEALDMLQAMNTGHDGSLTTGHSNNPREMLSRLETMVLMAGMDLPVRAIREQIAGAVQLILHQDRMRDGSRRVTHISEIVGMEGDIITMQDIFRFEQEAIDENGRIIGSLQPMGLRPKHYDRILDSGFKLPIEVFMPQENANANGNNRRSNWQ